MELYNLFAERFSRHMAETKTKNKFTDLHCRDEWKFDAGRLLRRKSAPHFITYFRYSKAIEYCPVRFMIYILQDSINLDNLIDYIISLKKNACMPVRNVPKGKKNITESKKNVQESSWNIRESAKNVQEASKNIQESSKNILEDENNVSATKKNVTESSQDVLKLH